MIRATTLLGLRRLRQQPLRVALAILAIAAGTALLVGVIIDQASLTTSLDSFARQRAGRARLEVLGPGHPAGLDASVLDRVAHVDGVATAAPLVQTVSIAEKGRGAQRFVVVFGIDCRIEAVVGQFGCRDLGFDSSATSWATSTRLFAAMGAGGVLRSDLGRLRLDSSLPVPGLNDLNHGNVAVFPLAEAQRRFGHEGALTSILIVPKRGVALDALRHRVQGVVGPQNQVGVPGSSSDTAFASMLIAMLLLMSLFGLAVGAQLVHNVTTLTLEERRRDLAVTAAVGAPPRGLLASALVEAALLGLVGGMVGIGFGVLVARPLVTGLSNSLDEVTGLRLGVHVPAIAMIASVLLGVAVSLAAAVAPARRAARRDVASELQDHARRDERASSAKGRRAAVYGLLALGGAVLTWVGHRNGAIEAWQPPLAYLGFLATVILSFRACQHGAAPILARVVELPGIRRGPLRVALTNLAGEPRRTGVMVMAVACAVGAGVVIGNVDNSIVAGSRAVTGHVMPNGVFVSSLPANNSLNVQAKLGPDALSRLARIDGVGKITPEYGFCGRHPAVGPFCVQPDAGDTTSFTVFRGRATVRSVFAHGEVLVGPAIARTLKLRPGDSFELPGRTGMRRVRVGAIWGHPNNSGASVTVPMSTFHELYGYGPPGNVLVTPAPGVSVQQLDRRIEAAHLDPDLKSYAPEELANDFEKSIGGFVTPFSALQRGMLIVAMIAVTSTLLLVGVQRRREHGLLMALGMAPRGLTAMVLSEAAIVGATGAALGTLAGTVSYVAMVWIAALLTGLAAPIQVGVAAPLLYIGIAAIVVMVAAAFPAWRTARLDPVAALRYE